jgi:hypothetical protein
MIEIVLCSPDHACNVFTGFKKIIVRLTEVEIWNYFALNMNFNPLPCH